MSEKILILGLGVSGKSCAAFLLKHNFSVVALDRNWEKLSLDLEVRRLIDQGLDLRSDRIDFSCADFSQMILSPGIDPMHPIVQKARWQNMEIVGEIEWAFRYLKNRCIGITGTNGKTTTTLLTTHILNQMGMAARALGNVGSSLSGYLLSSDPQEVLIIELSSFQLETIQSRVLDAALILNITPNHLDRHSSMSSYVEAKLRIQNCLKKNSDPLYVSSQVAKEYGAQLKKMEIFDAEILPVGYTQRGVGESQNIQAACTLCGLFGVSLSDFYQKMQTFKKPPHRMEWVAEINGVTYYNDSKASNVDAVIHAVGQLQGSIILLAGGVDKGSSYRPWIESFGKKVKKILVFGQAAEKIERELKDFFFLERVETLMEALSLAQGSAKEKDTVLLSPGCSSFDQFLNYEARGDLFKQKVLEWKELGWTEKKPF